MNQKKKRVHLGLEEDITGEPLLEQVAAGADAWMYDGGLALRYDHGYFPVLEPGL